MSEESKRQMLKNVDSQVRGQHCWPSQQTRGIAIPVVEISNNSGCYTPHNSLSEARVSLRARSIANSLVSKMQPKSSSHRLPSGFPTHPFPSRLSAGFNIDEKPSPFITPSLLRLGRSESMQSFRNQQLLDEQQQVATVVLDDDEAAEAEHDGKRADIRQRDAYTDQSDAMTTNMDISTQARSRNTQYPERSANIQRREMDVSHPSKSASLDTVSYPHIEINSKYFSKPAKLSLTTVQKMEVEDEISTLAVQDAPRPIASIDLQSPLLSTGLFSRVRIEQLNIGVKRVFKELYMRASPKGIHFATSISDQDECVIPYDFVLQLLYHKTRPCLLMIELMIDLDLTEVSFSEWLREEITSAKEIHDFDPDSALPWQKSFNIYFIDWDDKMFSMLNEQLSTRLKAMIPRIKRKLTDCFCIRNEDNSNSSRLNTTPLTNAHDVPTIQFYPRPFNIKSSVQQLLGPSGNSNRSKRPRVDPNSDYTDPKADYLFALQRDRPQLIAKLATRSSPHATFSQPLSATISGPIELCDDEVLPRKVGKAYIKSDVEEALDTVIAELDLNPSKELFVYPFDGQNCVTVWRKDALRLEDMEFLNDSIIEFYLKYLYLKLPDEIKNQCYFFNTFFFKKLAEECSKSSAKRENTVGFNHVRKWTKKVNLFQFKYIFVPINERLHWYLALIVNPGTLLEPTPFDTDTHHSNSDNLASSTSSSSSVLSANDFNTQVKEDNSELPALSLLARTTSSPSRPQRVTSAQPEPVHLVNESSENEAESGNRERNSRRSRNGDTNGIPLYDSDRDTRQHDWCNQVTPPAKTYGSKTRLLPRPSSAKSSRGWSSSPARKSQQRPASMAPATVSIGKSPTSLEGQDALGVDKEDEKDPNRSYIILFDSLTSPGGKKRALHILLQYLRNEARDKLGKELKRSPSLMNARVPQQPNHCDCGVYLLHYVETFLKAPDLLLPVVLSKAPNSTMWDEERLLDGRRHILDAIIQTSRNYATHHSTSVEAEQ